MKYITLIPFKSDKDVGNFINSEYANMNEYLKKIIPDVMYAV